jgi:DNA repair protein RadC
MDPNHRIKITKPDDILPHVVDLILKKQEHFICFTLNGAGELIEKRTLTVGLLNHSPVHPREVFADAITDRAASVVLVHNHPSGSPEPSAPDIEITRQLAEAGTLLGITVLDHIIVAARGHVSLKERGIL